MSNYYGVRNIKKDFINASEVESYNLGQAIKKMKEIASELGDHNVDNPSSRQSAMLRSLLKIIKTIESPNLISNPINE